MTLHTCTPKRILPSINILHLMVSEIQPRQAFYRCSPDCLPTCLLKHSSGSHNENDICSAFYGCGVENFYYKKYNTIIFFRFFSFLNTRSIAISYTVLLIKLSCHQTCKQSNRKVIDWSQLRCNSNSNRLESTSM